MLLLPDRFEIKLHGGAGGRIHLLRAVAAPQFPATLCSQRAFFFFKLGFIYVQLKHLLAKRRSGQESRVHRSVRKHMLDRNRGSGSIAGLCGNRAAK